MKLGLANIRKLLAALGNPQNNFLKVQVAGTNGKGSVCAFLDAICTSAGVNAGLYTSPHLVSITERIKANGSDISEEDFARHATTVRETAERMLASGDLEYRPTFFEQVTAIALIAFAEARVELAILETGLGGRLDATTAANAEIAAITRIDIDHQEYLGESIQEIAAEKAAIIHRGSKVVVADQCREAMDIVRSVCENNHLVPSLATGVSTTCGRGWLKFETDKATYELENLGLPGLHQIENAKVALLLAETLQDHFQITTDHIVSGLHNARHPGRLEYDGRYLFDGAHNVGGAKALAAYLDEFETRPITMIFGAMRDKEIAAIADFLFANVRNVILTAPSNSRSMSPEDLLAFVPSGLDMQNVTLAHSVAESLEIAGKLAGDDGIILVTGSLYLVGEVKQILTGTRAGH